MHASQSSLLPRLTFLFMGGRLQNMGVRHVKAR